MNLSHPDGYWATPSPPPHRDHAAVYIPSRDLLVAVVSPSFGPIEVWALTLADGDAWMLLSAGGPAFGPGMIAVHDPVGDRVLVHGGSYSDGRTWELRIDPEVTWSELAPASEGPGARWDHSAVYDSRHHRIILFGGTGHAGALDDAWELRLHGSQRTWTALRARGLPPRARTGHSAVYDAREARMIVVGGGDESDVSSVWELSLRGRPVWQEIPIKGGPGPMRSQHVAIADPTTDRILVHGGLEGGVRRDVWELTLEGTPTWSLLSPAGGLPPERAGHVAIFDPSRGRVIVAGGTQGNVNETWALQLAGVGRWDRLAPALNLPPSAYGEISTMRSAIDTRRGRLVVMTSNSTDGGRTWVLDFAPNPRWTRLFDAPSIFHDVFYDGLRDRMILHGGLILSTDRTHQTWELPFASGSIQPWTPLPTLFPPPARYNHLVVYDSKRDRMVVYGGTPNTVTLDTYLLSFGATTPTWSGVAAFPYPNGQLFPAGVYDEAGDRLIMHGDATWALDLSHPPAWTRLTPLYGDPPSASDAAYDPVARRMIIVRSPGWPLTIMETWALPLDSDSTAWARLGPRGVLPVTAVRYSIDYDPSRDRFVLVNSDGSVRFLIPSRIDDFALRSAALGAVDRVEEEPKRVESTPVGLRLALRSNPVRGVAPLALAVPQGEAAVVEMCDVRGRLVHSQSIAAGTSREVTMPTGQLAPGVYFVRLRQGQESLVRKLVITN